MAPTACLKCKKIPRKGAQLLKCSKCQKPFHDVCMIAKKGATSRTTVLKVYVCQDCTNNKTTSPNSLSINLNRKIAITPTLPSTSSTNDFSTSNSSISPTASTPLHADKSSTSFLDSTDGQANDSKLKLLQSSDVFHKSTVSSVVKLANNMSFNIDKAMSDMRTFFSEKLDLINTSLLAIPALDQTIQGLRESIFRIEDQLTAANSKLTELQHSQASLLSENSVLKDKLTLSEEKVFAMAETVLNLQKQSANRASHCTGICASNNNCDIRLSDNSSNNSNNSNSSSVSEYKKPFEPSRRHFSARGTDEGNNSSIIVTNIY